MEKRNPMSTTLTVGDVMTPSPRTIGMDAHLSEARSLMASLSVSHLPVMDGGVVESIISDREIERFTLPAHKLAEDEDLLVRDLASTRSFVADITDPLERVLRQMVASRTEAVVVLDQGELAGIFTERDACRVLADQLAAGAPAPE